MSKTPARGALESQRVAVIGLGYVGLPLCRAMWAAGHNVLGVDVDPEKVELLNRGRCYLRHLGEDFVQKMRASGRFEATSDALRLAEADAILICVPTPLDDAGEPDLSFVEQTVESIASALRSAREPTPGREPQAASRKPPLIVLESTTYPGTTREVVKPRLDATGVPYLLAFSPEREDPGRLDMTTTGIPKLVGGIDDESTRAAVALYATAFEKVIPVSRAEVAEAAKLLENIYRAVNIALVNEMKVVLDRLGIDIWEVVEAAATKPFGFAPFFPGPGLGGHCIPIDPFYLAWRAKQAGIDARFIELAGEVNRAMPGRVVEITLNELKKNCEAASGGTRAENGGTRAANGEPRILILGLAYKPDIDDVRESPSFELILLFGEQGCQVEYSDPHVPRTHPMRHYGDLNMISVALNPESLASFDAVVVSTAHRGFDWPLIARHARLIIDTRNALRDFPEARVVKA